MNDVQDTLNERGKKYGKFTGHADLSMSLKLMIHDHCVKLDKVLEPYQLEALHMICHKIARICNGDPNYDDSWRDIAGYAMLVVNELNKDKKPQQMTAMESNKRKLDLYKLDKEPHRIHVGVTEPKPGDIKFNGK